MLIKKIIIIIIIIQDTKIELNKTVIIPQHWQW